MAAQADSTAADPGLPGARGSGGAGGTRNAATASESEWREGWGGVGGEGGRDAKIKKGGRLSSFCFSSVDRYTSAISCVAGRTCGAGQGAAQAGHEDVARPQAPHLGRRAVQGLDRD